MPARSLLVPVDVVGEYLIAPERAHIWQAFLTQRISRGRGASSLSRVNFARYMPNAQPQREAHRLGGMESPSRPGLWTDPVRDLRTKARRHTTVTR